jgi:hypothetical protein
MHFNMHKLAVMGAVAAMSLASSSTAGASSVTLNASPTSLTATTTTHLFLHMGSATYDCTTAGATGTAANNTGSFGPGIPIAGPKAPASPADNTTGNLGFSFSNCGVAGITFTVSCTNSSNLLVTGATSGGVTPIRMTGISCTITLPGCGTATLLGNTSTLGGVNVSYNNGTNQLTLSPSGENLRITSSSCFWFNVGVATITGPSSGPLVYTIISPMLTMNAV